MQLDFKILQVSPMASFSFSREQEVAYILRIGTQFSSSTCEAYDGHDEILQYCGLGRLGSFVHDPFGKCC